MKKLSALLLSLIIQATPAAADYIDHRGHKVDSLEAVVAAWDAERIGKASDQELARLNAEWRGLMLGYLQTNGVKSRYYADKALAMAQDKVWNIAIYDAAKVIGQHCWAREKYDSAAFYYRIALDAVDRMAAGEGNDKPEGGYPQAEIDNGYSSMYGTLGNLYSMQDSIEIAMDYYEKAGELFEKHGWKNSSAVLYYNMGETWLAEKEYGKAGDCYKESLRYAHEAGDSLWIAGALKGLGALYLETGHPRKALRCLKEADGYFSIHEDEELRARLETLDFMGQTLKKQNRALVLGTIMAAALALLLLALFIIERRLRKIRKEQDEASAVLDETIEELRSDHKERGPQEIPELTERESDVLRLISDGLTNPQIAEKVFLSPETIKWYRRKLLAKFDAANSAELIRKASDMGLLKK